MRISSYGRLLRSRKAREAWPTEGALCDAFSAKSRAEGFIVHAECGGWDLLLVDSDGLQIGVEAKLRCSMEVLCQATGCHKAGPDVHAVLVPDRALHPSFCELANRLDLAVFSAYHLLLVSAHTVRTVLFGAQLWHHDESLWVPSVEVVGLGGGRASPTRLTPWKIAAVRLCAVLRRQGYLTRRDFVAAKLSTTWWVRGRDAPLRSERAGKKWRYVATGKPLPDQRWPEVADALRAEEET